MKKNLKRKKNNFNISPVYQQQQQKKENENLLLLDTTKKIDFLKIHLYYSKSPSWHDVDIAFNVLYHIFTCFKYSLKKREMLYCLWFSVFIISLEQVSPDRVTVDNTKQYFVNS